MLLDSTNINLQLGDRTWYVEGGEAGVVYLLDFALALLYFGLLPGLTGWTVGKLTTGIRVVGPTAAEPASGAIWCDRSAGSSTGFPTSFPAWWGSSWSWPPTSTAVWRTSWPAPTWWTRPRSVWRRFP